jgi:hypothetical protein
MALSPVTATASGYHRHEGRELDALLDDRSEAGRARERAHYGAFAKRLSGFAKTELDADRQADYELVERQIALGRLELEETGGWRRNPTVYVESFGNAIFTPYSLAYAPKDDRYLHLLARLEAAPAYFTAAQQNLKEPPPVWARVAREENAGTRGLIEGPIRSNCPPGLKAKYEAAAAQALTAMRQFDAWLESAPKGGEESWRLGGPLYARKFALTLGAGRTAEQVLAEAGQSLSEVRREMYNLSLPLHQRYFPKRRRSPDVNRIVGETLAGIARSRPSREGYFVAAEKALAETRAFVKSRDFLSLPGQDNLQLIETPGYMRGIYGVGGFNPAPALEPGQGAFYWLTPIGKDWPKERVESRLREYNDYGLRILTIHEAIPGHYVQFEYANRVEPAARRLLRSLFGSGVYVEGWAIYATEVMLDEGFLGSSPELRLTFLKQQLRAIANAILDIRLHTGGMKEEEAMELMLTRTFQEKDEAVAKWQRAQLSSCQLPTYWVGYREWKRLREDLAGRTGFRQKAFHEEALGLGALPMETLRRRLGAAASVGAGTGPAAGSVRPAVGGPG